MSKVFELEPFSTDSNFILIKSKIKQIEILENGISYIENSLFKGDVGNKLFYERGFIKKNHISSIIMYKGFGDYYCIRVSTCDFNDIYIKEFNKAKNLYTELLNWIKP
jgi:hypothetical protein